MRRLHFVLPALIVLSACEVEPRELGPDPCNGVDDNGNSLVDEGTDCRWTAYPWDGACVEGACVITRCESGLLDCDGIWANGCEVNGSVDARACGTCSPCDEDEACSDGVCVPARVRRLGGPGHQRLDVIVDRGGGSLALGGSFWETFEGGGQSIDEPGEHHAFVWSVSASTFATEWFTTASAPAIVDDRSVWVSDLLRASDGTLYVGGVFRESFSLGAATLDGHEGGDYTAFTGTLGPTGELGWLVHADPLDPDVDSHGTPGFAASASGVIVSGVVGLRGGGVVRYIHRIDANGAITADVFRQPLGGYVAPLLAVDGGLIGAGVLYNGSSFFDGTTWYGTPDSAMYLVAIDGSGGDPEIFTFVDGIGFEDRITDLVALSDGGYAVAHLSTPIYPAAGTRSTTIRVFDGNVSRWTRSTSVPDELSIASANGRVFVVGASNQELIPSLVVEVLDQDTGTVVSSHRFGLGANADASYTRVEISDAIAVDGVLWAIGQFDRREPAASPTASDLLVMSIPLTTLD